jgi:hypothetical protein
MHVNVDKNGKQSGKRVLQAIKKPIQNLLRNSSAVYQENCQKTGWSLAKTGWLKSMDKLQQSPQGKLLKML